ncbi:hypothetical protein KIPB_011884, partial [Kipferlia bialata]|eukprot:g11884.t1
MSEALIEIEYKLPIGDVAAVERLFREVCGGTCECVQDQCDTYFECEGKDFAKSDEAL